MPIFEYKCPACGKIEEVLVKNSEAQVPVCEKCGVKMGKQFSSFAAVVKEHSHTPGGCHCCPNMSCPKSGS